MVYIDMNMVRAGVVNHPAEWPFCGYSEIQSPRQRYALIDYQKLMDLLLMRDLDEVRKSCEKRLEEVLASQNHGRENKWTESIAVGSKGFVEDTRERLGIKAKGRRVLGDNGRYELREPKAAYKTDFDPKNSVLSFENTYFWNDSL